MEGSVSERETLGDLGAPRLEETTFREEEQRGKGIMTVKTQGKRDSERVEDH